TPWGVCTYSSAYQTGRTYLCVLPCHQRSHDIAGRFDCRSHHTYRCAQRMLGWLRGVHLRRSLVCHPAQWATKFTIHPRALHGADDLGLSFFAYQRTYSLCADASGRRFDLGYHAAVQTRFGTDYRLPLFQSFGMAALVLDRAVSRHQISKTRGPAMEATQVA